MGDRSGVGLVECSILEALDSLGAQPGRHRRSAKVLERVEERIGLAPGYAYEVLLDLARPWTVPVRLVAVGGNLGSRGNDPAANHRYTVAQLSPAGRVALAAEREELPPVPIGLINGNTHREGGRPPFRPGGIIDALRHVIRQPDTPSEDITALIGPPDFLTGCTVSGDLAALAAGHPTVLRLQARLTIGDDQRSVVVENLPPNANPDEVVLSLAERARRHEWAAEHPRLDRATRLPLATVSLPGHGSDRFVCVAQPGIAPEQLREQLTDIYGISTTVRTALPRPLPSLIRNWASAHRAEDLLGSLTELEDAIG
jgi:hypothetical protein